VNADIARSIRRATATCILLLAQAGLAQAQSTARIAGIVQDTTGIRIADAEIVVDGERRVRTDSSGSFTIADVRIGKVALRARRIGYFPREQEVTTRAGETTRISIALDRRPVLLDTIAVAAGASCSMRRFEGFACRRRSAKGVYFDVDAIDSINPRYPQDLFRGQPGFRVDAVRGGLGVVATSGWRCLRVLVNGYPPTGANRPPRWPNEIIGVEIYRDPDDVPGEYQRYVAPPRRCSMIIYWTLVRPRRQ
jgi:hypothetical protein